MNKNRNIQKYKDIVKGHENFFKNYYYHALIDLNLIKLDTILENGILSKKEIKKNSLPSIYTHRSLDFDSKNGDAFVSLTKYPEDCQFSQLFESFSLHTLTSCSLLVSKEVPVQETGARQTFFDDEIFCFEKVDKNFLKGILLPDHLTYQPIEEVNCLANDLSCYTRSYINHWLTITEAYFQQEIPKDYISKLWASFEIFWDIVEEYDNPGNWIDAAIETQKIKYGEDMKDILAKILKYCWSHAFQIENLTYIDIIQRINSTKLPVYEITEKSLKKIL